MGGVVFVVVGGKFGLEVVVGIFHQIGAHVGGIGAVFQTPTVPAAFRARAVAPTPTSEVPVSPTNAVGIELTQKNVVVLRVARIEFTNIDRHIASFHEAGVKPHQFIHHAFLVFKREPDIIRVPHAGMVVVMEGVANVGPVVGGQRAGGFDVAPHVGVHEVTGEKNDVLRVVGADGGVYPAQRRENLVGISKHMRLIRIDPRIGLVEEFIARHGGVGGVALGDGDPERFRAPLKIFAVPEAVIEFSRNAGVVREALSADHPVQVQNAVESTPGAFGQHPIQLRPAAWQIIGGVGIIFQQGVEERQANAIIAQ